MFCNSSLSFYNKKRVAMATRQQKTMVELFPQIIVGTFAPHCFLPTILVKHALEDQHIAGSHI